LQLPLLEWDKICHVPWSRYNVVLGPRRTEMLWMWNVAFRLQFTTKVSHAEPDDSRRSHVRSVEYDDVLEVADAKGSFAGRVLCQMSSCPQERSIFWRDMEFIVLRSYFDPHEEVFEKCLILRLGMGFYKYDKWQRPPSKFNRYRSEHPDRPFGIPTRPPEAGDGFYEIEHQTTKLFYVLLIHWHSDGVAERVGVGLVVGTAIRDSLAPGPVWKEILLC
jgi:hypothetical protein